MVLVGGTLVRLPAVTNVFRWVRQDRDAENGLGQAGSSTGAAYGNDGVDEPERLGEPIR